MKSSNKILLPQKSGIQHMPKLSYLHIIKLRISFSRITIFELILLFQANQHEYVNCTVNMVIKAVNSLIKQSLQKPVAIYKKDKSYLI